MKKLPLEHIHKKLNASFIDVRGWQLPAEYNGVIKELTACKESAAILDRSYLGKVILRGPDALDLIDRISTNDMKQLIFGDTCDTVFCTPKGRIVDYCRILKYNDDLILISSYIDTKHILEWLNRFIILEDVEVLDCSKDYLWLTLLGPEAFRFVKNLAGVDDAERLDTIWLNNNNIRFPALPNKNFSFNAYNFCLPVGEFGVSIFSWLADELKQFGGEVIGDHAFQITRVESGMPDWGTELTQDYNPHEARIISAVSFTKGCYTGQEVIARLDTYDKVQKYLMIIDLESQIFSSPPIDVFFEDEKIGVLTSYAFDPINNRSIGLGYIKKNYAVADFNLKINIYSDTQKIYATLRTPPDKSIDT